MAVEVVSPNNLAQDVARKIGQYLMAGSRVVWVVYPPLELVEVRTSSGMRRLKAPESLTEQSVFAGYQFSLDLTSVFSGDPYR